MISIDGDFIILSSLRNGVFVDKRLVYVHWVKRFFSFSLSSETAGLHRYIKSHWLLLFKLSVYVCISTLVSFSCSSIFLSFLQTIFLFKSHFMYENRLNGLNKNAILSGWIWNFLGLTSNSFLFLSLSLSFFFSYFLLSCLHVSLSLMWRCHLGPLTTHNIIIIVYVVYFSTWKLNGNEYILNFPFFLSVGKRVYRCSFWLSFLFTR